MFVINNYFNNLSKDTCFNTLNDAKKQVELLFKQNIKKWKTIDENTKFYWQKNKNHYYYLADTKFRKENFIASIDEYPFLEVKLFDK